MKNIGVAITHFERFPMVLESFINIVHNDSISEIIISDDCSTDGSYEKLKEFVRSLAKVKLCRNFINIQMGANKMRSISLCDNDFVAILDSDNVFQNTYVDALIQNAVFEDNVINIPEFAEPDFNFTKYAGQFIDYKKAKEYMNDPMFRCALNCCNYLVPKEKYLEVYKHEEVHQADTIAFNYKWLKAGYIFYVVPGCRYVHRVHENSGFLSNLENNMKKAKHYENLIMQL